MSFFWPCRHPWPVAKLIIACAPPLLTYGTAKWHTRQHKTQHEEAGKQKQLTIMRLGRAGAAGLAQRARGQRKVTSQVTGTCWCHHLPSVPCNFCQLPEAAVPKQLKQY